MVDLGCPPEKSVQASLRQPRPPLRRTEVWTLSCSSFIKKWPKTMILKLPGTSRSLRGWGGLPIMQGLSIPRGNPDSRSLGLGT